MSLLLSMAVIYILVSYALIAILSVYLIIVVPIWIVEKIIELIKKKKL